MVRLFESWNARETTLGGMGQVFKGRGVVVDATNGGEKKTGDAYSYGDVEQAQDPFAKESVT